VATFFACSVYLALKMQPVRAAQIAAFEAVSTLRVIDWQRSRTREAQPASRRAAALEPRTMPAHDPAEVRWIEVAHWGGAS
jgi:hypothetical protein